MAGFTDFEVVEGVENVVERTMVCEWMAEDFLHRSCILGGDAGPHCHQGSTVGIKGVVRLGHQIRTSPAFDALPRSVAVSDGGGAGYVVSQEVPPSKLAVPRWLPAHWFREVQQDLGIRRPRALLARW